MNNTVLSNFAKIGRLDLLLKTLRTIYVTQEILDEYNEGVRKNKLPPISISVKVIRLSEDEKQLCKYLRARLDPGEASSIAVAIKRKLKFLTDDFDTKKLLNVLAYLFRVQLAS